MHVLVASLVVAGFTPIRRAGRLHLCNEAETGSLALRLMRSPSGASALDWDLTPPGRLLAERATRKATSFQVTRSARLGLAHRIARIEDTAKILSSGGVDCMLARELRGS